MSRVKVKAASVTVIFFLQIHEKEEEEMNEKNENGNCLSEEPLITADQVSPGSTVPWEHNLVYI